MPFNHETECTDVFYMDSKPFQDKKTESLRVNDGIRKSYFPNQLTNTILRPARKPRSRRSRSL